MTEQAKDHWWTIKGDEVHTSLVATAQHIRDQDPHVKRLRYWRDLYLNGYAEDGVRSGSPYGEADESVHNVIREAVDTMHAKLAKSRPRAWIVTDGGDYELQDRSKLLTTWVDGEFERLSVYPQASDVLQDCCVYGTGVLRHSVGADGRPAVETASRRNLFVDPHEEEERCVRTLYQIRNVDKGALTALFPDGAKAKAIKEADNASATNQSTLSRTATGGVADLVTVTEAWRLGIGDKPGQHCIAIEGATLLNDEWPAGADFPFDFIHYSRDPERFFGIGLPERLCGSQEALNHLSMQITQSFRTWVQHMFIDINSGLSVEEFKNEVGGIHVGDFASGQAPFVLAPSAIGGDWISYQRYLADRMLQSEGISPLAARSDKPAGLNSGKALIVHQDVESERHMVLSRAFEQLHVDCAKQLLACAEIIVKSDDPKKSKLRAMGGKRTLEVVHYDEARMDSDQYQVRVQPASSLSKSPAGKLQEIQNMADMGIIKDPDAIRELLDFPDLDSYNDLESSGRTVANKLIDAASRGKQVEAIEEMPLDYTAKRCRQQICLATVEGKPESKISALRNLLGQVTNMIDQQAQAEAAAQQAAMPPPPAGPVPVPPGGGMPMDMGAGMMPPPDMAPPMMPEAV